jgi:hypothetical protein
MNTAKVTLAVVTAGIAYLAYLLSRLFEVGAIVPL